ncbi:hypothetical protein BT93_B2736 [Corymbia citriodora subsp. variegata]|nr:hypothetical protein BT93_B2736 [Corymbia citriodora subsp. variegata]
MEIEVMSTELIKPANPTPDNLKIHKISLLDQLMHSRYSALVFFYQRRHTALATSRISQALKSSLSQTLTRFYPFAGKIKDRLSIECDDGGVAFSVARARWSLSWFLDRPDPRAIQDFLPGDTFKLADTGSRVAMIQVTSFACGGIAVGALVAHMVTDGIGMSTFLKAWAARARESMDDVWPDFNTTPSLFPQYEAFPEELTFASACAPCYQRGWSSARRLVFDGSTIARMKDKATSSQLQKPSRVEAVSALICKSMMAAANPKPKAMLMAHYVDLRRRATPTIPNYAVGNHLFLAVAQFCPAESNDLPIIAGRLREATARVDGDLAKGLQGEGGFLKLREAVVEIKEVISGGSGDRGNNNKREYLGFTSMCNFGLYEINFGWGNPAWVTSVGLPGKKPMEIPSINYVFLSDTRCGNGIEAWVLSDENRLLALEKDPEILEFAVVDPSPLKMMLKSNL